MAGAVVPGIVSMACLVAGTLAVCHIEVQGYGYQDPCLKPCPVSIKLNQQTVYSPSFNRGIHFGLVNVTSCSLVAEPSLCDMYGWPWANTCLNENINAFPDLDKEIKMILVTGDMYTGYLNEDGKEALRKLGIPEAVMTQWRASMIVMGRPGCDYIAAVFNEINRGPSQLRVQIQVLDKHVTKTECSLLCTDNDQCGFLQHNNGVCTLFLTENVEKERDGNQRLKYSFVQKFCPADQTWRTWN